MEPYNEPLVISALDEITATYREAGREPDLYAMIWAVRMQYDCDAGLPWPTSEEKHLRALRSELGLTTPDPIIPAIDTWPRYGLSYYTSLTDPRVNPVDFAARLRDSGCDYTRVWLIDAWALNVQHGTGCYTGYCPWRLAHDGRYDLWDVLGTYLDRLRLYVESLNAVGILPQLSGLELYSWSTRKQGLLWVPDANLGPLRRNRQGVYYAADDAFTRIAQPSGEDAFLGHFYTKVVETLDGLVYTVELANEMPEKALHYRLRDRWREAGYTGTFSVNRQDDTPGQYANMKIGSDFDRISYHGKKELSYLDTIYSEEPVHKTFRQFYSSHPTPSRIALSSDGCRKSTNVDDAYDYPALEVVFHDAISRGFSIEHQSCMKLRGFTENRISLDDLEVNWFRTLLS